MGHDEFGRRPNEAQKRTQTVDQRARRKGAKQTLRPISPRTAAIQLRPFCFYWGYSYRGRQPHFRHRAYDELVEALIARGLPFALTTGHGQASIDQRYRAAVDAEETVRFCNIPPDDRRTYGAKRPGRRRAKRVASRPYLSDALIASNAFDPGHNSRSESSLSGLSVVPRTSCSSLASSSI